MRIHKHIYNLLFFLFFIGSLSSCGTSKYLDEDEYLLRKNTIIFEGDHEIPNERNLKFELSRLHKQKPNSKLLFNFFINRAWFHLATKGEGDTTKFDDWQRRALGEKPSIYEKELSDATVEAMNYYLQYKGFYNSAVYVDETNDPKRKKIDLTYYVTPGQQHKIDSVFYTSKDTSLQKILDHIASASAFIKGQGLDIAFYERDKERIASYLKDHGYAFFYPSYFSKLQVDTSQNPQKANIYVEVLPPYGEQQHTRFKIGKIIIDTDFDPTRPKSQLEEVIIEDIIFTRPKDSAFILKPRTIINELYFRPGEVYSQKKFDKSNQQLSTLGVFRFVRLRPVLDTLYPDRVNIEIELRTNKRMEVVFDFDVNYTNRSNSTQGQGSLIGLAFGPTYRHRNLFNGAETLVTNLSAGVEINPALTGQQFWNTIDLGLQNDLYIPKFQDYFGIWKGLSKLSVGRKKHVVRDTFYNALKESATTRISANYNYLLILDWYRYNLINVSYGFDYQPNRNERYIINHLELDFLRPITELAFQQIQAINPFLERSFGNQLFVSLLFRDFSWVYNSRKNQFGESHYIGFNLEIVGAEIWAINEAYNLAVNRKEVFGLGITEFSQYLKTDIDFHFTREFSNSQSLATRAYFGVATPFRSSSDVPYVKQFYVGGPNSIRAWAARGLGPGGYDDPQIDNFDNNILLYQTGDIKLEFNAEYRFDLFFLLKGAIFLDIGNVWTINRDTSRCGSQFLFRERSYTDCADNDTVFVADPFYRQFAIGSGFGIRLDLSYILLRLDMGLRLRNPFPLNSDPSRPRREADYWETFEGFRFGRDVNFNLGLGYPF